MTCRSPTAPARHVAAAAGLVFITVASVVAQRGDRGGENQPPPPEKWDIPPAPPLSPEEALDSFTVEDGFRIEIAAADPLIHDPVAAAFDERGRLWVAELRGYMPNVEGEGEHEPNGRIMILKDTDGDGRMDEANVVLDGLVLPRTIAIVNGGVVISTPPELYFVPVDRNDRPGEKQVIDPSYARGGNVEHQPNGMLRNVDNWFYNAKSDRRYYLNPDGSWTMEKTAHRGQWGITNDDFGRLFYNTNSSQLLGDDVLPDLLRRNENFEPKAGLNRRIARDQATFPVRVTPGVNRGYRGGTLRDDGTLRSFTAACGPLIYRGDQFPPEYYGNAFVCEPSGNLVKRNVLTEGDGGELHAEPALKDREFLASTDERFRPVNLLNGPDGALYVIDFYRGIIQHKAFVTTYLRRQIIERELESPLGLGRIYRVVHDGRPVDRRPPQLAGQSPEELARHLNDRNAWNRETAQRLLVEQGDRSVAPLLERLCAHDRDPQHQIHALRTLQGLRALTPGAVAAGANSPDSKAAATAVAVSADLGPTQHAVDVVEILEDTARRRRDDIQLQRALAAALGQFEGDAMRPALTLLAEVCAEGARDDILRAAAISGLAGKESAFLAALGENSASGSSVASLRNDLAATAEKAASDKAEDGAHLDGDAKALFAEGLQVYQTVCMGCHQENGQGLTPIAPPLAGSEWVTGSPNRLAAIVLNGLTGPITVAGTVYKEPDIQPIMPGLKDNPLVTDRQLAAVLTYVRNAWGHDASPVDEADMKRARADAHRRGDILTEADLRRIP